MSVTLPSQMAGMQREVHPRILIVEDEKDIVQVLEFALKQAGFEPVAARDAGEAFNRIRERTPDAVILDLMLPGVSGTEICRQLKSGPRTASVPVIMLTARGEEMDRVGGFELGADDYITKPFSVREVVLRVKAVLRRGAPGEAPPRDTVGPVKLDLEAHRVFVDGAEVELTALEFRLLQTFMARVGRVQSREQLLRDVWEMTGDLQTRTVDTHVKRLREKLGSGRDLIETVRGLGYRMYDPAEKGWRSSGASRRWPTRWRRSGKSCGRARCRPRSWRSCGGATSRCSPAAATRPAFKNCSTPFPGPPRCWKWAGAWWRATPPWRGW